MTKTNQLYFLTHDDKGEGMPNGFYCEACFKNHIEVMPDFIEALVSVVDPENTPYYRCQICEVDYRD